MTSVVIEKTTPESEVKQKLTLEQFLQLSDLDGSYELFEGDCIKKMSPKFFHSSLTTMFWVVLSAWCDGRGRVRV